MGWIGVREWGWARYINDPSNNPKQLDSTTHSLFNFGNWWLACVFLGSPKACVAPVTGYRGKAKGNINVATKGNSKDNTKGKGKAKARGSGVGRSRAARRGS